MNWRSKWLDFCSNLLKTMGEVKSSIVVQTKNLETYLVTKVERCREFFIQKIHNSPYSTFLVFLLLFCPVLAIGPTYDAIILNAYSNTFTSKLGTFLDYQRYMTKSILSGCNEVVCSGRVFALTMLILPCTSPEIVFNPVGVLGGVFKFPYYHPGITYIFFLLFGPSICRFLGVNSYNHPNVGFEKDSEERGKTPPPDWEKLPPAAWIYKKQQQYYDYKGCGISEYSPFKEGWIRTYKEILSTNTFKYLAGAFITFIPLSCLFIYHNYIEDLCPTFSGHVIVKDINSFWKKLHQCGENLFIGSRGVEDFFNTFKGYLHYLKVLENVIYEKNHKDENLEVLKELYARAKSIYLTLRNFNHYGFKGQNSISSLKPIDFSTIMTLNEIKLGPPLEITSIDHLEFSSSKSFQNSLTFLLGYGKAILKSYFPISLLTGLYQQHLITHGGGVGALKVAQQRLANLTYNLQNMVGTRGIYSYTRVFDGYSLLHDLQFSGQDFNYDVYGVARLVNLLGFCGVILVSIGCCFYRLIGGLYQRFPPKTLEEDFFLDEEQEVYLGDNGLKEDKLLALDHRFNLLRVIMGKKSMARSTSIAWMFFQNQLIMTLTQCILAADASSTTLDTRGYTLISPWQWPALNFVSIFSFISLTLFIKTCYMVPTGLLMVSYLVGYLVAGSIRKHRVRVRSPTTFPMTTVIQGLKY